MASELGASDVPRARSEASSVASSRRSSAFKALEDATTARPAVLEAQRALVRLASTHAESNAQH